MAFWHKWFKRKEPPPVDRTKVMLSGGGDVPKDASHTKINPATGQQAAYVVLTPEERAKGFVRPVRMRYVHLTCKQPTWMANDLAESWARDPQLYMGTFCATCKLHCPVHEFVWEGTSERLGT